MSVVDGAGDPHLEFQTDMPVGEILRRTRVHYGQSLEDVETNLRIRASQLEALENGETHKLPGRVYAIGFVRSYAEYLGLDGDKVVHLFKQQAGTKARTPDLNFPAAASDPTLPPKWIVLAALAALIALIFIGQHFLAPRETQEDIPEVSDALREDVLGPSGGAELAPRAPTAAAAQAEGEAASAAPQQGESAPATPAEDRLELQITRSSWVEIKNAAGDVLVRRVLTPGTRYIIPPGEAGLVMSTGNAGGVNVLINGEPVGLIGGDAEVVRGIELTKDALLKRVVNRPVTP